MSDTVKSFLLITQAVLAILLTLAIIVQTKGVGFGRVWGTSHTSFTRRGLESAVFKATFVLSALFILVSFLQLVI